MGNWNNDPKLKIPPEFAKILEGMDEVTKLVTSSIEASLKSLDAAVAMEAKLKKAESQLQELKTVPDIEQAQVLKAKVEALIEETKEMK